VNRTRHGGVYFRVCKPDWLDCTDISYGKMFGGRWNPPGAFGALYLNRTIEVAAAQARQMFRSGEATVFDLRPERRPQLLEIDITECVVLDAVTDEGLASVGLPSAYPYRVDHVFCQRIGARAHAEPGISGIACRSASACSGPAHFVGEELALFDRAMAFGRPADRPRPFADWYPD
jgi:RES domain-containing protein